VIDLHTHVLPGLDDGARTPDEAIAIAQAGAEDGVVQMAATPHLRADHPGVEPAGLPARCDRLNQRLTELGVPIEIISGGEVDIYWAQAASPDELRLVSYATRGRYLLVETPYGPLPEDFESLLFQLTVRGFRIVLAHPERSPSFQRRPGRLQALLEQGLLAQVTASTLLDAPRRSPSRRLAEALVAEGSAHVLATDTHGAQGRGAGRLSAAAAAADGLAPGQGRRMTIDIPAAIVAGEDIPRRAAPASRSRGHRLRRVMRAVRPRL
jgi:protein-tyrosine phosphatase